MLQGLTGERLAKCHHSTLRLKKKIQRKAPGRDRHMRKWI